jgi:hypothetical protein
LKLNGQTAEELKTDLIAKHPDLVIYSKDDANKWTPESGGGDTPGKLFKKAKLAFASGDIPLGKEYLVRMEEVMAEAI